MDVDTKTPIKNLLARYKQVEQTEQVTYEFDDPSQMPTGDHLEQIKEEDDEELADVPKQ